MVERTNKHIGYDMHKILFTFLILISTAVSGQENVHLKEAKQISIVVADDATIKSIENNKKAVFLIGQTYDYLGLLIKVENTSDNPFVRIRKKTDLTGSYKLQKYSDNEYFYYGDPGTYIVEYIDLIDKEWVNEFLEAEIIGSVADIPNEPGKDTPGNQPDNGPIDNALSKIKDETYKQTLLLGDKEVMRKLLANYKEAYELSIGKNDEELRRLMRDSRRNTLMSIDKLDFYINSFFANIDNLISQAGPDKYRLAIEHFISGMQEALKN